jgi:hypothetical protein
MSRIVPSQSSVSSPASNPTFIEVASINGFKQGDPIFQTQNDFSPYQSSWYSSNANFTSYPNQRIISVSDGSVPIKQIGSSMNTYSGLTPSGGGFSRAPVAVLTSGNIVTIGRNTTGNAQFIIYNNTFTSVVVAKTTITCTSSQYVSTSSMGVIALTGGGFVIYWTSVSTPYFTFAIYSNTGTVVKAVTQYSSNQFGGSGPDYIAHCVPLSTGNWAFGFTDNNPYVITGVYNSSGTLLGSVVNSFSYSMLPQSAVYQPVLVARNNGTYVVLFQDASTSTQVNAIYLNSSSGSSVVSTSGIPGSYSYAAANISAAIMSDGLTYAFAKNSYNGNGTSRYGLQIFFIDSTNTVVSNFYFEGNQFFLPSSSGATTYGNISLYGLSSGNLLVSCVADNGQAFYFVINKYGQLMSANTALASSPATGAIKISNSIEGTSAYNSLIYATEFNSQINLFFSVEPLFSSLSSNGALNWLTIDETSYSPVSSIYSNTLSYTSSLTVGSASTSTITPLNVKYYLSSNIATTVGTLSSSILTSNTSLLYTSPIAVSTSYSYNIGTAMLTNGNFVVAYRNEITTSITAKVYNYASGTLIGTVQVDGSGGSLAGYPGTLFNSLSVTPMSSGKFAVTYLNSAKNFTTVIFTTSSTSVLYSSTISSASGTNATAIGYQNSYNNNQGKLFQLSALTGDRLLLVWTTAIGNAYYEVYSNASVLLTSGTVITTGITSFYFIGAVGVPSGGFVAIFYNPGTATSNAYSFNESALNTFTVITNYGTQTSIGTSWLSPNVQVGPRGEVTVHFYDGSYQYALNLYYSGGSTPYIGSYNFAQLKTLGSTGNRGPFCKTPNGSTLLLINNSTSSIISEAFYSTYSSIYSVNPYTDSTFWPYASSGYDYCWSAAPGVNNGAIFAFNAVVPSANSTPILKVVVAQSYNPIYVNISTTTISSNVSISNWGNTTFIGIGASNTSANSIGLVQISGATQLNSNAVTGSQAFDYTTYGGLGVKGTMINNNVLLLGNQ